MTAVLAVITWLTLTAGAQAAPGPAFTVPEAARQSSIRCFGDLAGSPRTPVLLVHGTATTAEETWRNSYRPVLLDRGHGVCEVTMPGYAFGDVQTSVEYVATAIAETARRSGRKIAIIGHSQGGFQPVFAMRIWPHLAAHVEDFIGLAGAYDRGAQGADCSEKPPCPTAYRQIKPGSALLSALARRRLPDGPSYTAIATLKDATVSPQPQANELPPGGGQRTEVQIEDICPGRQMPTQSHMLLVGDAVAYELAMDAVDHPGPADPDRIDRAACDKPAFDGVDYAGFATVAPTLLTRKNPDSDGEPPLRCFLRPACTDLDGRGRVLAAARITRRARTATLRVRAQLAGTMRVTLRRKGDRRSIKRTINLTPGARSVRLTRRLRPGTYTATITTVPEGFDAYVREARIRFVRS